MTETKIQYVHPEIPKSLLEPCSPIQVDSIKTNGELLMSYISLQTAYSICSTKVISISNILRSYNSIYNIDIEDK